MPPVQIGSQTSWTPQERWVWNKVCSKEIADFNREAAYGGLLDPKNPEGWNSDRRLSAEFLQTVLLSEPYRDVIPANGVRISGAWFQDSLDFSFVTLSHVLWLSNCRFESDVLLRRLETPRLILFSGSKFVRKLNMNSVKIGQDLLMHDGAEFTEVDLTGAGIEGVLDTMSSKFTGKLNMGSLRVGQRLLMGPRAEFAEVDLIGAKIEGQVDMIGSKFTGKLEMNNLHVGQSLLMRDKADFAEVGLTGAKIEGQLAMTSSKFTGKLNMDSLRVGQHLFMREKAEFAWLGKEYPICLISGEIGGDMDISDSQFPSLDLTGTKIHGELRLGSGTQKPVRWHQEATLILRNTDVGALQDTEDAWPGKITLDDFSYSRLGGLAGDFGEIAKRKCAWFTNWLAKSEYSPQPYEQLGEVLQKAGYQETANQVLYAGKQREKKGSGWCRSLWMFLQDVFIGYGFKLERSLYWVIILTALGMVILTLSDQGPTPHSVLSRFFYTLDRLLPFIQLDKAYDNVTLTGYTQIYFYLHRILGYFLGFFIIAGLSGLTKK